MTNLNPSMRLKMKRDTFFLPNTESSVYFRNNLSSFLMEGRSIDQWIEKIMPMLNGEYTLGELTNGLQGPYKNRVYEIAEALYQNGFVRDVSHDRSHQLEEKVLTKYAEQIEYLDSFGDSGAYRFQTFRQSKVLAIGSGPFLVSLISALIECGLPKFHMLVTDSVPTNRRRLAEIVEHTRKENPEIELKEINQHIQKENNWTDIIKSFDSILYVSESGDVEELCMLNHACREEKKLLLPAVCLNQVGLAGPLVHPDNDGCWESAWRRLHKSVFNKNKQLHTFSSTSGAMLANVIVFELFKKLTGCKGAEQKNHYFLLDLETLEGSWHSFVPHPMVTDQMKAIWVRDFNLLDEKHVDSRKLSELLLSFSQMTSAESGIFHIWGEGELNQLPLAQCRVQATDPFTEGAAELLPSIVCSGLTHEEARIEAGLTGIEAYLSNSLERLVPSLPPYQEGVRAVETKELIGVGTGESFSKSVYRGLQKCLEKELRKRQLNQKKHMITKIKLNAIDDERSLFYLKALTTLEEAPIIGLGDEFLGFPVVWVGTNNCWNSSIGLNMTMAFRNALQQAIMMSSKQAEGHTKIKSEDPSVLLEEGLELSINIPHYDDATQPGVLQTAIHILEENQKRLFVFKIRQEPFLNEKIDTVGVLIREEEPS
ncbi:putative thiazole-containing bacteriocin maturation protein [Cytobacillus horneckiae]|uniref:putative thiazole-containing bacteriocin maturation protein n=1 Tax=Cytobacillus horneckiae TaxID=549687 RepID=UPI0039A0C820